jgi:hypothetical protein
MEDGFVAIIAQTADNCRVGVRRVFSDKEFKRRHSLKALPRIDQALLLEPIRETVLSCRVAYVPARLLDGGDILN